jgi:hypothetical protein
MKRTALSGGMLCLILLLSVHARPEAERGEDWVRQRVRQIKASDTDDWRRIPWSASLTTAAEAARKQDRPMFVFSHDGNIETGRC